MEEHKSLVQSKKNYHHGDLREQLLEAVRELVEEHGPDGFTIAQACRLAGVSTAAPYKHFTDRHEILRGVVLLAMERLMAWMQAAVASFAAGDPRRVVALGQAYIDFAQAEPGVFRLMFGMNADKEPDCELEAAGETANGLVERVVAEHFGNALNEGEVKLRAYALWCVVHGHSFLKMDSKLPEKVAQMDEMALLHLIGTAILPRQVED